MGSPIHRIPAAVSSGFQQAAVHWHTLAVEDAFAALSSGPEGLSAAEAAGRLAAAGPNELQAAQPISPWTILLSQFRNVLIVILLLAASLSAFLGHALEAAAIAVIVLFAVALGFVQEYRAERSIEALRRLAAPTATALRDGKQAEVPARDLVPGDVILIRAGNKVPADARLTSAYNLQVDEAALTGESAPVEKQTDALDLAEVGIGDRKNMVYAGTTVTYGRGAGLVVATGMNTEFGSIARLLETVERAPTPLQQNLDRVGRTLARAALAIVAVIVISGLMRGQPFLDMLVFGVALAVAVVPEALPAVVTISLAIGVQRMVRRNALIRRLPAVETLGATSVICSDKTGTLTKDEMTARRIEVAGRSIEVSGAGYEPVGEFRHRGEKVEGFEPLTRLLTAAALASDAYVVCDEQDGRWKLKGDPTEGALVVAAAKAGLDKQELDRLYPRVHEIPFTSETKRMTTVHKTAGGLTAYSKGAPETILASCSWLWTEKGAQPLDAGERERILQTARHMAKDALRVLAVAFQEAASTTTAEHDMTFLGLVGMIDPPRPEAKAAVKSCAEAGVKVVMITGDHPLTAEAVARELGVLRNGRVVTGVELDAMSDSELESKVDHVDVYARVSPAHKLRVVTALKKRGHITAMTGDGINDAPALKKADIGIAMGITGTDVTKEAAAMTLTDDNFASIVAAVEEARGIYANIKKYLMYLLSANIGEIGLMAGASALGLPLPLSAVQILYVNLATDGLPALALAVDPPEEDLMRRPPHDPRTGIFTRPVVVLMLVGGWWSALVNLCLFAWMLQTERDVRYAMTSAFVSLVLIEFLKAYSFRSPNHSILHRPFANKWLNLAVGWELALLGLILHVPPVQKLMGTTALTAADSALIAAVAVTIVPALEVAKWAVRRRRRDTSESV